jgi:hypothetical protein
VAGGVLASTVGGRVTFALAGAGALLVWGAARSRLIQRPAKEVLMPVHAPLGREDVMPMSRR